MWKKNFSIILAATLFCFCFLLESQCAEAPSYVDNFDIYPREVNVGSVPQDVIFTLHLVNKSDSKILPLLEPPKALYESTFPNSDQTVPVEFKNIRNDVFKGTVHLSNKTDSGMWKLVSLRLTDRNDNILDLKNELATNNISTDFNVNNSGMKSTYPWVYVYSVAVLLILFFIYYISSGYKSPFEIYRGEDGASSASKLQLLIWTIVAIFSYTAIYADRVMNHSSFVAPSDVPSNLLLAMGLSAGTALAAKYVTGSQVRSGKVQKEIAEKPKGGIFLNDNGDPDLSKIQMMAWTLVAAGIYLFSVYEIIQATFQLPELPDINSTLLILMGIGEGAYVGKKIVTVDDPNDPRIFTISPVRGFTEQTAVTLSGVNFGEYKREEGGEKKFVNDATRQILIGNKIIENPTEREFEWSNTRIKFIIPELVSDETIAPRETDVSLIVNGRKSNPIEFKVIDEGVPHLDDINPKSGPASNNLQLILTGKNFGTEKEKGAIYIDSKKLEKDKEEVEIRDWKDDQIEFIVKKMDKKGLIGSKPRKIWIEVEKEGNKVRSNNSKIFNQT